jgi:hypothetical protein
MMDEKTLGISMIDGVARWNKSIRGPLRGHKAARSSFAERTSVSCFSLALEQPPTKASAECGRDGASPRPGHHYRAGRIV